MKIFFVGAIILVFSQMSSSDPLCNRILNRLSAPTSLLDLVGVPLSFEEALSFAYVNLPSGEVKEQFEKDIKNYLKLDESEVLNRGRIISFLKSEKIKNGKVFWNLKIPKDEEEGLNMVFEAIRLVEEQSAVPLERFTIYTQKRQKYVADFLESAKQFISIQYLLEGSIKKNAPVDPPQGRAAILTARFKTIFLNILWFKEYRGLRGLQSNNSYLPIANDNNLLEKRLARDYTPEITFFWYLKHIRNVQHAATIALVTVLVPEITGAYIHEANLDRLEQRSFQNENYAYARQTLADSDQQVRVMLEATLRAKTTPLKPEEEKFLSELDDSLRAEKK